MKPQFKNIDIKSAGFAQTCPVEWASKQDNSSVWRTAEQIQARLHGARPQRDGTPRLCFRYSSLPARSL